MQDYQKNLPPAGPSGHSGYALNTKKKNFVINYDPENNKNNIYLRKLNKDQLPESKDLFSANPLTKMLQPQDVTKSKRYVRDKLNISDIPGAQSDVYKRQRHLEGREYIDTGDIEGARPAQLKQNKPHTGPDYKFYTKDINPDKWQSKRMVDPQMPIYEIPTKSGRKMRIGQIERSAPKVTISPQTKRIANYIGDIEGTRPRQGYSINEEQRVMALQNGELFRIKPQSGTRNTFLDDGSVQQLQQQVLQSSKTYGPVPNSHYARFQTYQNNQGTTLNPEQSSSTILQQDPLMNMPIKSGYRLKYTNQMQQKPFQNLSQDQVIENQQQQYQQPVQLLGERLSSKRINTFQLLENKYTEAAQNLSQLNQNNQYAPYINNNNGSQSYLYQPHASESPKIQERVWSKAQNIGGAEIQSQQNMRINSSISQNKGIEYNISMKKNFNQNIYEKGLLMNSGHKSFVNSGQGQINPLNNEVNRSVDQALFKREIPISRDQRLSKAAYFNPITAAANSVGIKMGISQSSNISPQKNMLPPTTSKVYGNFLDGKQIDQMISQLKMANSNPII